jgi:hypothetical protein
MTDELFNKLHINRKENSFAASKLSLGRQNVSFSSAQKRRQREREERANVVYPISSSIIIHCRSIGRGVEWSDEEECLIYSAPKSMTSASEGFLERLHLAEPS